MKNQYFGDNRDLFKYDLIVRVIKETGLIKHFMFIPMLTENDDTGHGEDRDRKRASAGTENELLVKFLNRFEEKGKRDIEHLKSFFGKQDIEMTIYHGKDKYFSHTRREEYFKQIRNELLRKSLVFIDPDIGLEVDKLTKKHIRYDEIKDLYKRMGESSILMIFQYIPYVKRENYFPEVSKKLKEKIGNLPIYISDNQIVFFFLTKDASIRKSLTKIINKYREIYPNLM